MLSLEDRKDILKVLLEKDDILIFINSFYPHINIMYKNIKYFFIHFNLHDSK